MNKKTVYTKRKVITFYSRMEKRRIFKKRTFVYQTLPWNRSCRQNDPQNICFKNIEVFPECSEAAVRSYENDTLWKGFKTAQNVNSGLVEWNYAVVITTTPQCHKQFGCWTLLWTLSEGYPEGNKTLKSQIHAKIMNSQIFLFKNFLAKGPSIKISISWSYIWSWLILKKFSWFFKKNCLWCIHFVHSSFLMS